MTNQGHNHCDPQVNFNLAFFELVLSLYNKYIGFLLMCFSSGFWISDFGFWILDSLLANFVTGGLPVVQSLFCASRPSSHTKLAKRDSKIWNQESEIQNQK